MPIIEVDHVVKKFRLGQSHSLRQTLRRLVGGADDASQPKTRFNALDDITFSVEPGEVLGIIGTNGAGKSTLLKVLAGITTPTTGTMRARGRIAPLIEVGAGLIADLTGRENIYLNGVILGMSIKEIKRKMDDILSFAELEDFADTPIKRYSSGMAVRLGFSIATVVDADILIVDEVLAVGDVAFQRKCFDRMEDIIKNQGKTILLVSHNIRQVERLCTRTILLDHGRILADGDARQVCKQFYERTNAKMKQDAIDVKEASRAAGETRNEWPDVELLGIHIIGPRDEPVEVLAYRDNIDVEMRIHVVRELQAPLFSLGIHTADMLYLATHDSDVQMPLERLAVGHYVVRCSFRRSPLLPGVYSLRLGITEGLGMKQVFYGENLLHFQVATAGATEEPPANPHGFFALDGHWQAPCESDAVKGGARLVVA